MDLYRQEAELELLQGLAVRLQTPRMLDVGAELGSLTEGMVDALERVDAFEPDQENVNGLRARLGGDARVVIHELALGDHDGEAQLHLSAQPDGTPLSFGHTLLQRADTDEIAWGETVCVRMRSLASLLAAREIPRRTGILKIDTEGSDLAVLAGMGELEAEIVMVEHWSELPHGLGTCPWSFEELLSQLRPRGFEHFAFLLHRGELVSFKWDDASVERGYMGNVLFIHEGSLERLLPALLTFAGELSERLARTARRYMSVADERRRLLDETASVAEGLKIEAEARLSLVHELEQAADERLNLVHELEQAADERLRALEQTTARIRAQEAQLEALREDSAECKQAADARLSLVNDLERAAKERLRLVQEFEQAADERLKLVHELERAADERLRALEETTARVRAQDVELAALREGSAR